MFKFRLLVVAALAAVQAFASLPPGDLVSAITARRGQVLEFRLIAEAARELGVRVWLFGGTAAGFAHYVRWDEERRRGDTRYIAARFDYDFTNIYRSTQDADLVVDGDTDQARRLEELIRSKLAHLQGAKSDWEVRLLRKDCRDHGKLRQALLANPDFLDQHTDSNSTGLVELTDAGEPIVRDLRDWENTRNPAFLVDCAEGKLHYYFSAHHRDTTFFRRGENPEIFSVIRYLTKAFQYELGLRDEDRANLLGVIAGFDRGRDLAAPTAKARFEALAKRLVLHAANVEYAIDTLDELGLRKKIVDASDPKTIDSAGWWLSREPLRTKPVGQGEGRTIARLGWLRGFPAAGLIVAHETNVFTAYESIVRDTTGRPNVLISRSGVNGESAAFGDGFYTRIGREGARGTGLTIRFSVDPRAREGSDFTITSGDYIVWHNRAAIRVVPESLDLTLLEFLEMLASGKAFDTSERGVIEKLKRRIATKPVTAAEADAIVELFRRISGDGSGLLSSRTLSPFANEALEALERYTDRPLYASLLREQAQGILDGGKIVFADGGTYRWVHPLLARALRTATPAERESILERVTSLRDAAGYHFIADASMLLPREDGARWLRRIIPQADRKEREYLCTSILPNPRWKEYPDLVRLMIDTGEDLLVAREVLSREHWASHPELIEHLMARGDSANGVIARDVLTRHWAKREDWAMRIAKAGKTGGLFTVFVLPHWDNRADLVEALIDAGDDFELFRLAERVMGTPEFLPRSDLLEKLVEQAELLPSRERTRVLNEVIRRVLSLEGWHGNEGILGRLIANYPELHETIIDFLLQTPRWRHRADWFTKIAAAGRADRVFIGKVLSQEWSAAHPEWFKAVVTRVRESHQPEWATLIVNHIIALKHWGDQPELYPVWRDLAAISIFTSAFPENELVALAPYISRHLDLVPLIVRTGVKGPRILKGWDDYVLPKVRDNPELRALCGGDEPTYRRIQEALTAGRKLPSTCKEQLSALAG